MKTKKLILFHLLMISICLGLNIHCSGDRNKEKIIAEYIIKPKDRFIIYGIDIEKILNKKFSELEKELNSKTRVDEEVSVVFLRKENDFVTKSIRTNSKDMVEIRYGPVEDLKIYKKYKDVISCSIVFYGGLNVNDKPNVKNYLIEELRKNLPADDTTKKALNDIQHIFMEGVYKPDMAMVINFEIPRLPVASFSIVFTPFFKNEIFYKFIFSRKDVAYPPP